MTRDEALRFAERWIENWNKKDVEAILFHFAESARFTSPEAERLIGKATLANRSELGHYWREASQAIAVIQFRLDHAIWDPVLDELVVVYEAILDDATARAVEIMRFDERGYQIEGEALYGAHL